MGIREDSRSGATVVKVADEEDWISLLIASERVSEWLDTIRWGQPEQKRRAAQTLLKEVESKESYVEEAKAAGTIGLLTSILRKSGDEELMSLAAAIIAACSGHSAAGRRVQEIGYGGHVINIQEGALGDGLGARIWVAAHCLCRHLEARPKLVNGLSVLEIGSGCGLAGLLAAKLGAEQVTLSDYEESVLLNLQACAATNCLDTQSGRLPQYLPEQNANKRPPPQADHGGTEANENNDGVNDTHGSPQVSEALPWDMGNVRVRFLDWIEAMPEAEKSAIMKEDLITGRSHGSRGPPSLEVGRQFPVIIGSDLIYELYHADMVAAVLHQRLAKEGTAYIALAVRRQAHLDRLLERAAQLGMLVQLQQQEVDPEAVGIVGRENEYEGGFVLLTISFA